MCGGTLGYGLAYHIARHAIQRTLNARFNVLEPLFLACSGV